MTEINDFNKGANANEVFSFNVSTVEQEHNTTAIPPNINNRDVPPLESFDSKHMNRAWCVCWGTTTLILLFLLFLWFYFETTNNEY